MILMIILILIYLCYGHNNNMNVISTNLHNSKSNMNIINKNDASLITVAKADNKVNNKANSITKSNNGNKFIKFLVNNWFIISEIAVVIFSKYQPSFFASGGKLKPGIITI